MKINFALMAKPGVDLKSIKKVLSHEKAKEPCKIFLEKNDITTKSVDNNGEAARLIAEDEGYGNWGALGPACAARKYGLEILKPACEDSKAVTTFFLLGPRTDKVIVGKENRMLIAFKVKHCSGALVDALLPFKESVLNLIHIDSKHVGNGSYHFVIEIDVNEKQLDMIETTLKAFSSRVESYISFGPFEVMTSD